MGCYENMLARLTNETSKMDGSFATDNLRAVAMELENIWKTGIEYMPHRFFPTLAAGEDLTRAAENFGVARKPATRASVDLTVTGTPGAMVYRGYQVAADGILFTCAEDAKLDDAGAGTVRFTANDAGAAGNVPAGVTIQFVASYAGLITVENAAAASGGTDEETDDDLRERVRVRWATPSTGGNAADYVRWALSVPGVARAKALNPSAGNVTVCIVADGNEPADAALVAAAQEYIDTQKPLGANVTVESGAAVTIGVSVTLILMDGYSLAAVTNEINAALRKYIASLSLSAATVSYGKIMNLLFVDGVVDVTACTVNGGTASVALTEKQFPVLGVTTIVT